MRIEGLSRRFVYTDEHEVDLRVADIEAILENHLWESEEHKSALEQELKELMEEFKSIYKIHTVTIVNTADPCAAVWSTPFSDRKRATAFMEKVWERIKKYNLVAYLKVTIDNMELDSEEYLTWLDEEYGEEQHEKI